jgi:hypothetical protein
MFGFDFFPMLVVDIMHEFELGVWKALFIHLLRILDCIDPGLIIEMNRRYNYLTFYITGSTHSDCLQVTGKCQPLVKAQSDAFQEIVQS